MRSSHKCVIYNDKIKTLYPDYTCNRIPTYQILPYVELISERNEISWNKFDRSIEMGYCDIENNKTYQMPIVWHHIKILSLSIEKGDKQSWSDNAVFRAEIAIYPKEGRINDVHKHTFLVENGIYLFLNCILRTINSLLDKGVNVEDINFDFLDDQCVCFNFNAANDQPSPTFELSPEITPQGYYSLIEKLEIEVYTNGISRRNDDDFWKEVSITLQTTNAYVISVVDKILSCHPEYYHPYTDRGKTTFYFHTDTDDYTGTYSRKKANGETINSLKSRYIKKLITEGIPMLDKEKAIEFLSIKNKKDVYP